VSTIPAQTYPAYRTALNRLLAIGIADAILLVVLLYFAFVADNDSAVSVIGPIHGIGFLALVALSLQGIGKGWWGWWFPAVIVVTGGPVGSIVGDVVLRKKQPA